MKKQIYVLLKDVVIPAGTVLDRCPLQRGGEKSVEAIIAMGKDASAYFNMGKLAIQDMPADLIAEIK